METNKSTKYKTKMMSKTDPQQKPLVDPGVLEGLVYTYLLAMRTISSLLSPETPTICWCRGGQ